MPAVFAKPDFGFSPNASKHTKARNKPDCVCIPVKPDCACRSCKAGLRLLGGVYDGYDIPPYEGRGGIFSAKRFVNRVFQNEGEGVSVFPSRRVMRKRSGRSNASASAETVARSENCRAQAFRPLLLGMLFRRLRGHARTFCEWQSAGVVPPSV